MKIGRNDSSHCGSGKKYKKCWLEKDEAIINLEDVSVNKKVFNHYMRRAIADTYSRLGQYNKAEVEFEQLIKDLPDNPWGYIGLWYVIYR